MTRVSHSIRIEAPTEDVWATLADLGAIQDYNPGVSRSYYTSEQREGVGASRHCDLIPFGEVEERIVEWRDGEAYTLEIYDGRKVPPFKKALGFISVEEDGSGSIARFALEYELKYGLLGRLLDLVMVRRQFSKVPKAVLRGLKRHVEGDERSSRNQREVPHA